MISDGNDLLVLINPNDYCDGFWIVVCVYRCGFVNSSALLAYGSGG